MADLPFDLPEPLAVRLRAAADVEGKILRALEAVGSLAGSDVGLVDIPAGPLLDSITAACAQARALPASSPLVIDLPNASLDVVVGLWSSFRGVHAGDLAEVDRVLRPDGRLLVVHDYGRDEVSALADPTAPVYTVWSRRDGPYLRGGGFRIRVLHCFWTFASLEDARDFLTAAFGVTGEALGAGLKRPRLSWNVAVYHRLRGGVRPPDPDADDEHGVLRGGPATLPGR